MEMKDISKFNHNQLMKIYKYPSKTAENKVAATINRTLTYRKKDYQSVRRMIEAVRMHGDEAVLKYAR